MTESEDSLVTDYHMFPSPSDIAAMVRLPTSSAAFVARSRDEVRAVLEGTDDRLLVITGPCSVHDPQGTLEYAARLAAIGLDDELLIVIRAYPEKPRTVAGWTGLLNDPALDGSHDVRRGLREARQLLVDLAALGLPTACEWVSPVVPSYLADAVTWSAIGARTTESQVHRHLASSLPTPVGFKNATDGDVQVAANACMAAMGSHTFLGITPIGTIGLVTSSGNSDCHVVLRGGRGGPNFDSKSVARALKVIEDAGLPRRVVIDAAHGNSGKDHRRQPGAARSVAAQVAAGERAIVGMMLESFLVAGRQEPGDLADLVYGQSITDACMDFATTQALLRDLAEAVRRRRQGGSR